MESWLSVSVKYPWSGVVNRVCNNRELMIVFEHFKERSIKEFHFYVNINLIQTIVDLQPFTLTIHSEPKLIASLLTQLMPSPNSPFQCDLN